MTCLWQLHVASGHEELLAGSGQQFFVPAGHVQLPQAVKGQRRLRLRRKANPAAPSGATLNERGTPRENRLGPGLLAREAFVMAPSILPTVAGWRGNGPGQPPAAAS